MTQSSETLDRTSTAGPALHVVVHAAPSSRAVVGLLHGYADHAGRYAHAQRSWADLGLSSVALDLRGHGRSLGARGACERFDDYGDDLRELEAFIDARFDRAPRLLFAHSFGGLVALWSLGGRAHGWRALATTNPYLALKMEVPALKKKVGALASLLAPKLSLPAGVRGEQLSHDAAIARGYESDPLVFKTANARWFTETARAQQAVMAGAPDFALPLWLGLGLSDPLVDARRAAEFFRAAASRDKTLREYPALFHELLMEPEWAEIARDVGSWFLQRA